MRIQMTKYELVKLSAILMVCLLGIVPVGRVRKVSAQDSTNPPDAQPSSHTQQAQLSANDGVANDNFGNAVAMSNNTAVVGASHQPSQTNRGGAYVFVRNGTAWSQQQKLLPVDVINGDAFGTSVAIDVDTIVAGAPTKNLSGTAGKGAAYVFVRSGTTWSQQQQLTASDGALNDNFGTAVAVSGNTILVGAVNHAVGANTRQGTVYVYVRNGTTWTEQQKLAASDGLVSDQLGGSVALVGNTAVAGAREDNFGASRNGKVYVFLRNGTTWSQQQKLTAGDGSSLDAFGNSVSVNHNADTIAVGAFHDDEATLTDTGSAYVFVRSGSTWSQQQRVLGSLLGATGFNAHFGTSVAVDGEILIVGSPQLDPLSGNGRGAVYLYDRSGSTWTEQNRFVFPPAVLREFGGAVAMSGDSFIGGAQFDTVGGNLGQGSAYVYSTGHSISIADASVLEGPSNVFSNLSLTVTLSAPETQPVVVNYSVTPGTATAGSPPINAGQDYIPVNFAAITFNPGETSKTIQVADIQGDALVEPDETFFVDLVNPVNASTSKGRATVTIMNDDTATSTVQFRTSADHIVDENCTTVSIPVDRFGDTSGVATVDYFTTDISASERSDYTTANGTLRFASGESSKTIDVLINADSLPEGDEAFFVNLTNAVGVTLDSPFFTAVLIRNTPTSSPNLIDDPRDFVGQHYHDFLNRQPDQSGWDFWTNEITSCGTDAQCVEVKRINVSASFYLSIEFQQTGYLVEKLYKAAYGDATGTSTFNGTHQLSVPILQFNEFLKDAQGIRAGVIVGAPGWEQQLENQKQAFAAEFVQRSRFTTALPTTMTPTQFVDQLNTNAVNVLSTSERTTAINLFGGAGNTTNQTARAQALRQVAEDKDLDSAEFNRAFVLMQYFGYLRRNPNDPQDSDYTGYDFWLTKLNQFNGNYINAEMVKAFITSIEYRQRFGR